MNEATEAKPYESKLLARLMRDAEVPNCPWEVEEADPDGERCILRLPNSKDTVEVYWTSHHHASEPWAFGFGWGRYTLNQGCEQVCTIGEGRLHYNTAVSEARRALREAGLEPLGPPETRNPLWPGGPEWKPLVDAAGTLVLDSYVTHYVVDGRAVHLSATLIHRHDGWTLPTLDARELEKARRQSVVLPLVQYEAALQLAAAYGHHWAQSLESAQTYADVFDTDVPFDDYTEDMNGSWLAARWRELEKAKESGHVPLRLIDAIADKVPAGPVPGVYLTLRWPSPGSTSPWLQHTTTTGRLFWSVNTQGVVLLEVRRPEGKVLLAVAYPKDGTVTLSPTAAQISYGLRHLEALLTALEALDITVTAGQLYPLTRELDAMQVALDLASAEEQKPESEAASVES